MTEPSGPDRPDAGGGQARLLASGSLAQQVSQVSGLLAMFAIVTVLARHLSIQEFGVYGLLSSLAGYLLVIQNSAASAAVRNMAAAGDAEARDRVFSTALLIYVAAGLLSGVLLTLIGLALAAVVDMPAALESQARVGALLTGIVTAIGWPITIYRDALRASQLFVRAAMIEVAALVIFAALLLTLTFSGASLEILIGASATIPLFAGLGSAISAKLMGLPFHFRRNSPTRAAARELGALAFYVSITEAAGTIIYALDRVVLGLFQPVAAVARYEGPVRAHNLIRALNAALSVTVLPSASRYFAEKDERRLEQLLLRGSRYTLALIVPLTVTGMVLAGPLLGAWLGPDFRDAGRAMAILLSYWLLNGCTGVLGAMIIAGGRAYLLARFAWIVAIVNLALSLALTPSLGLEGVTIGTAVPYIMIFPVTVYIVLQLVPVGLGRLLRTSFLPAYSLAIGLAAALAALRIFVDPESIEALLAISVGGVVIYWLTYYVIWLEPHERELVRDVARGVLPGGRAAT